MIQNEIRVAVVTLIALGLSSSHSALANTVTVEENLPDIVLMDGPTSQAVNETISISDPANPGVNSALPKFSGLPASLTGVVIESNVTLIGGIELQTNNPSSSAIGSLTNVFNLSLLTPDGSVPLLSGLLPLNLAVPANQPEASIEDFISVTNTRSFTPGGLGWNEFLGNGFLDIELGINSQAILFGDFGRFSRQLSATVSVNYQTRPIDDGDDDDDDDDDPGQGGDGEGEEPGVVELPEPSLLLAMSALGIAGILVKRREPVSKVR